MSSLTKTARVAGLLYFLACIPAPFSLIYVPRTLIVPGNATATASKILAAIFWGLWLFPFGILVYRSGFLPRILGVLLIINCFAYVIPSFTFVLLPQYRDVVSRIAFPALFAELAIALWLLIRGARDRPLAEAAA